MSTSHRGAVTFYRLARTVLLAVIVGAGSAVGGFILLGIGILAAAARGRRLANVHRDELAVRRRQHDARLRWDDQWNAWGGRLPARRPR